MLVGEVRCALFSFYFILLYFTLLYSVGNWVGNGFWYGSDDDNGAPTCLERR